MPPNKTQRTQASVTAFLATIPDPDRREDTKALVAMIRKLTGDRPAMWGSSIVGFGEWSYRGSNGKPVAWFPIGLSPRKGALTLYLMGGLKPQAALLKALGRHKVGGGCLLLPRLSQVDTAILTRLIKANAKLAEASAYKDESQPKARKVAV
jgi:hypothetical protein